MSAYGRNWDHIRQVRDAIKARCPNARTDTIAHATTDVDEHCAGLRRLLAEWLALETGGGET